MAAAVHNLLPVLAAGEPSKTPFYIAGGLLVAWAVLLALGGMNRPDFPGTVGLQRAVMGVSALLVAATIGAAIGTSTKHHNESAAKAETNPQSKPALGHEPAPPSAAPPQESAGSGAGGSTVKISADPSGQLHFQQASVTAKPGKVTIDFDNPAPEAHDVTIERAGKVLGKTKVVTNGKASVSLPLQPGSYTFYCSVDSHRQAGMQGALSVQSP